VEQRRIRHLRERQVNKQESDTEEDCDGLGLIALRTFGMDMNCKRWTITLCFCARLYHIYPASLKAVVKLFLDYLIYMDSYIMMDRLHEAQSDQSSQIAESQHNALFVSLVGQAFVIAPLWLIHVKAHDRSKI
jgi:hypothetical protein